MRKDSNPETKVQIPCLNGWETHSPLASLYMKDVVTGHKLAAHVADRIYTNEKEHKHQ